jgi:hypothetical protein
VDAVKSLPAHQRQWGIFPHFQHSRRCTGPSQMSSPSRTTSNFIVWLITRHIGVTRLDKEPGIDWGWIDGTRDGPSTHPDITKRSAAHSAVFIREAGLSSVDDWLEKEQGSREAEETDFGGRLKLLIWDRNVPIASVDATTIEADGLMAILCSVLGIHVQKIVEVHVGKCG